MKKIVLACGAGAATSTLVAQKVATLLDANGYADKYEIKNKQYEFYLLNSYLICIFAENHKSTLMKPTTTLIGTV